MKSIVGKVILGFKKLREFLREAAEVLLKFLKLTNEFASQPAVPELRGVRRPTVQSVGGFRFDVANAGADGVRSGRQLCSSHSVLRCRRTAHGLFEKLFDEFSRIVSRCVFPFVRLKEVCRFSCFRFSGRCLLKVLFVFEPRQDLEKFVRELQTIAGGFCVIDLQGLLEQGSPD